MPIVGEVWRPVVGFEGGYLVSTAGRVKSADRFVNCRASGVRLLRGSLKTIQVVGGRASIQLWRGNRRETYSVGVLVLSAFVGPRPKGTECCHSPDPNPSNCRLSNLRWDTHENNCADKYLHGTQPLGECHHGALLTEDVVRQLRIRRAAGESWKSLVGGLSVSLWTVRTAVNGRTWQHVS